MVLAKKKSKRKSFFYKLVNTGFFGKKYKGIKIPRGWISRLKKSHDLEIFTRPTCRGSLRQKKFSNRKSFFLEFTNLKIQVFLENNIKT